MKAVLHFHFSFLNFGQILDDDYYYFSGLLWSAHVLKVFFFLFNPIIGKNSKETSKRMRLIPNSLICTLQMTPHNRAIYTGENKTRLS